MRFVLASLLFVGFAMHHRASAQASLLDSLYAVFAQAKTDSARLEASFEIIQLYEGYESDEEKRWIDTTAAEAERLGPGHRLSTIRQLYYANWLRNIGDFEKGYQLAMATNAKFRAINDTLYQAVSLFEAGTTLSEFNAEAAIGVMRESVAVSRLTGDDGLTARCLTNLCYAMEMAGKNKTEEYRTTTEQALEVFRKHEDMEGILVSNFNLVEYFSSKKQFELARLRIAEMEKVLKNDTDEVNLAYPLVSEANVLWEEGRYAAALPKYEQGWGLVKKYEVFDGQMELYPKMIEVYKTMGDYPKAFQFLEEYKLMKDSLLSAEKSRTVQNLQTRYETEKKEAQIQSQQADLARSRMEKWTLGAVLLLLTGLASLFWRQRRKTQSANLELAASNTEIQQKNRQLDLLMRELHHRVKNNLQLVSSLLSLQSRQVGDEGAATAIKAGQLRVEAMSLIHQRLYREEGVTMVNMQDFAQDLVGKIAYSFGYQTSEMDIRIQFDPVELDVDKAMPMSLILNELLTNSFKYAFGQTTLPAISIQLLPQGEKSRLHYADNGSGLPSTAPAKGSFGSKLIASLSGQLGGEARQWNDGGAHFELVF